jgi:hypothetical protein
MHPDTLAALRLLAVTLILHPEDAQELNDYGHLPDHLADVISDHLDDDEDSGGGRLGPGPRKPPINGWPTALQLPGDLCRIASSILKLPGFVDQFWRGWRVAKPAVLGDDWLRLFSLTCAI